VTFDPSAAATLCEDLSLARAIPKMLREQARHELYFHLRTVDQVFDGWRHVKMTFVAPPGWRAMNPSVTRLGDQLVVAQRCTNYLIDDRGPSAIPGTPPYSRTFLLDVHPAYLSCQVRDEVTLAEMDHGNNEAAQAGFEDMRIIERSGELWGSFVRCNQNEEGWTEQWLAWISNHSGILCDRKKLHAPERLRRPEKNWIPFVADDGRLLFVYLCDPTTVIDENGKVVAVSTPSIAADHFRGSSQGIPFHGGLLALVHSVTMHKLWPKNMHRFVWLDRECRLRKISDAFLFPKHFPKDTDYLNGYQYGMGLCWHPLVEGEASQWNPLGQNDKLVVSYSIGDGQGFLATLDAADVWQKMGEI
jgi:hypothetical protein